jgi:hypothetical protein
LWRPLLLRGGLVQQRDSVGGDRGVGAGQALLQNHFGVSIAKCFFRSGCHNRHNLYDTKNEFFVLAITDRYKKLQLGVGCLCQLTRKIDFQKQKNSRTQIQARRA